VELDAKGETSFWTGTRDRAPGSEGTALTCHWVFRIAPKEEAAKEHASRKKNDKATEGKEGRSSRREREGSGTGEEEVEK
jgi:hypothetical protein